METAESPNELAKAVFEKLWLHCRRKASGLVRMMESGDLDIFDGLAVAPLALAEEVRLAEMAEFERRRLAWLDAYQSADCDDEADAAIQLRKGAH